MSRTTSEKAALSSVDWRLCDLDLDGKFICSVPDHHSQIASKKQRSAVVTKEILLPSVDTLQMPY